MAGPGSAVKLGCPARTLAVLHHDRFIRIRCKDRRCPDAQRAKAEGTYAIHVFDLETRAQWTDFEKPRERQGVTDDPDL